MARPAPRYPRAAVASPHYLATASGLAVLADGGNALDAAIATNLTLGVVTPYLCGFGGDLFALVWDGAPTGYLGSGRAPAAATRDAVTVPGAPAAWFDLLDRYGTRDFATLARDAIAYARDGFPVSDEAAVVF